MLFSIFLALFLPCVGMSAVFVVYICLLRFSTNNRSSAPGKRISEKGLSASDLEKLPKTSGKELTKGTECAVCLDEMEGEQPVRVVPGCNHSFHLQCADSWLSKQSFCPVCRARLMISFSLPPSNENPC